MENGRIRQMGTAAPAPPNATVVDLTGKFVVPGIVNAHGHVGPAPRDPQLRRYALYGVTTTTSMSFDPDDIAAFKARQKAGDLRGAHSHCEIPVHVGAADAGFGIQDTRGCTRQGR